MSSASPKLVACITGANRGMGYEVSRQLAMKKWHVIMCGRNMDNLKKQVTELQKTSSNPYIDCYQLDLLNKKSISTFIDDISSEFQNNINCLVNNAAIYEDGWNENVYNKTLQTNIFGPIEITQGLLNNGCFAPISQIVNVSSGYGCLSHLNQTYSKIISDECSTIHDLLHKIKYDKNSSMNGQFMATYKLSKAMLNRFTQILANNIENNIENGDKKKLNEEKKNDDDKNGDYSIYSLYNAIYVNCVCPGWVRTAMGGPSATRSVEEGASSIMWLINQDIIGMYQDNKNSMPNGSFLRDGKIISFL